MFTKRSLILLGLFLICLSALLLGYGYAGTAVSAEGYTVIGTGTPASCQSNAAVNALTDAVLAGGVIDFNCGPDTVTIHV